MATKRPKREEIFSELWRVHVPVGPSPDRDVWAVMLYNDLEV